MTQVTWSPAQGGSEGRVPSGCPSKNLSFLVVVPGKAGNHHQKKGDLGEARPPRTPPPRKLCNVKERHTMPYSDAQKAVMGRWDLVVQTPGGEQPAWLEIRHSGHQTLVGQFVGWHGSARPIARVDVDDSS